MSAAAADGKSLYELMFDYQVNMMDAEELVRFKAEQAEQGKKRKQIEDDETYAQALLTDEAKKQKTANG